MKKFVIAILIILAVSACVQKKAPGSKNSLSWAKGAVWYQIFPERFRNGDTSNDPTVAEVSGAADEPGWKPHPWGSDWFKLQPWELKKSKRFYDVVFNRFYGGDLRGVINRLSYIKRLGIDAIYFNPLFEAPSTHKYDGSTYHHIDNNFGADAQGDIRRIAAAHETDDPRTWVWSSADSVFLELIKKAHQQGIRIVIDGVFNHTGTEFFAFRDVIKNQQKSIYADWYDIKKWDDPATAQNEFDFHGWWGFKGLPELYEDSSGFRPAVWKYIFAASKRWLDPNGDGDPSDGIDGWRLDVADQVKPVFWRKWRAYVKSINPRAIVVAELWSPGADAIRDKRFDAAMNYPFAYTMLNFFVDQKKKISAALAAQKLDNLYSIYGPNTMPLMWNLIDSHDTDRLASMIINPDLQFDRMRSLRDNPKYLIRKPSENERELQKLIVACQMSFVGSPLIYYGDEAGMWGDDDPDDRKPMLWADIHYDNEKTHPLEGHSRPDDINRFDFNLFGYYQKMIQLRRNYPALKLGEFRIRKDLLSSDVLAFERFTPAQTILCLFNRAGQDQTVDIPSGAELLDIETGKSIQPGDGHVLVALPGHSHIFLQIH